MYHRILLPAFTQYACNIFQIVFGDFVKIQLSDFSYVHKRTSRDLQPKFACLDVTYNLCPFRIPEF